jgi:GNAT superfamily N-acetyltransferase
MTISTIPSNRPRREPRYCRRVARRGAGRSPRAAVGGHRRGRTVAARGVGGDRSGGPRPPRHRALLRPLRGRTRCQVRERLRLRRQHLGGSRGTHVPAGYCVVARLGGIPVGCGALKLHGEAPAELKRMWVDPGSRGLGVGRRLLESLEALAREDGVKVLHLETNRALKEAIEIYCKAGWEEVAPFNDEPHAHHWFEKSLSQTASSRPRRSCGGDGPTVAAWQLIPGRSTGSTCGRKVSSRTMAKASLCPRRIVTRSPGARPRIIRALGVP